jgi:hypothetical protein
MSSLTLVWIIFCDVLTLFGVGWGMRYDLPDFAHIDYGFPLKWATHTLVTIAGPANTWTVDIPSLLIDIAIWQTALVLGTFFIELKNIRARRDLNPRPPG